MEPDWTERSKQSRGLPNLGFGGTLVTVFVTSFFAAKIVGALCVILSLGGRAYFSEGLRVSDWRHATLSNGQRLPWPSDFLLGLGTFLMWAALIGLTELAAGVLTALLKRFGPWVTQLCRCAGGVALFSFSTSLYASAWNLIHPIPLSGFIGGLVLIWKGAGRLKSAPISRLAPWIGTICRLTGAAAFFAASLWLWKRWPDLTHPVPLAAFIVGAALIWKATIRILLDRTQ